MTEFGRCPDCSFAASHCLLREATGRAALPISRMNINEAWQASKYFVSFNFVLYWILYSRRQVELSIQKIVGAF